jgi:hypothetical protein
MTCGRRIEPTTDRSHSGWVEWLVPRNGEDAHPEYRIVDLRICHVACRRHHPLSDDRAESYSLGDLPVEFFRDNGPYGMERMLAMLHHCDCKDAWVRVFFELFVRDDDNEGLLLNNLSAVRAQF